MVKSKRGISIMIGYVLLISIALVIGTLVYAWARTLIPQDKLECPEGSSLVVKGISCIDGQLRIELYNNGKRNINDIFFKGKTKGDRELANLDLSNPDAGGLVALRSGGAMEPGGIQILDSKFYDESCTDIGTGECIAGSYLGCEGTFDCTNPQLPAILFVGGLNCPDVGCSGNIPSPCTGSTTQTCNQLTITQQMCEGAFSTPLSCSPINPPKNYKLFSIEITPERQQEDKNGKKVPVVCGDAIIKQQLDNCFIYPVCGDAVVQASNGETCDDGNSNNGDGCETDCTLTP